MNIAICFVPGSGGNFVAGICKYLIDKIPIQIHKDGHSHFNYGRFLGLHLSNNLDNESFIEEMNYLITKSTNDPIILGHFRNLAVLQKLDKKVIYIDFDKEDISSILTRYNRLAEKGSFNINSKLYKKIAGANWPSYDEYCNGSLHPELLDFQLNGYNDWYWIYNPTLKNNLLKLSYKSIFNSFEWIDDISNFLNISEFDRDYLISITKIYHSKNLLT